MCTRRHVAPLFLFLIAAPAHAAGIFDLPDTVWDVTEPPSILSWTLLEGSTPVASLTINNVPGYSLGSSMADHRIFEHNAASFGADWQAWSDAVNDPLVNMQRVTWNGVSVDLPINRELAGPLEELRLFVIDYVWPIPPHVGGNFQLRLRAVAITPDIIPEPVSASLVVLLLVHISCWRVRHGG